MAEDQAAHVQASIGIQTPAQAPAPVLDPVPAPAIAAEAAALEVDSDLPDNDSSYGSDGASELTSLNSGVTKYVYENGRRYHAYKEGKYYAPNDEQEMDREDMKHHWATMILGGKYHLAPIGDHPTRMLDLGTGTGIWCIDIGDLYPSATVIGTDLSKIQPSWVPPNVSFEIDDWDDEWTYGSNRFDLIHTRFNGIAIMDYPGLLAKAYDALKPGGYIEFVDHNVPPVSDDGTLAPDSSIVKFYNLLIDAGKKAGRDLNASTHWENEARDAGFVNVTDRIVKAPIGTWPKNARLKQTGWFVAETLREGLPAFGLKFLTKELKWTLDEANVLFAHVRSELNNNKIHSYLEM
ncbi:S-adenosyl-L-methionine-dependent methyltransferase [Teratosphaeria destructans]|uniref:S-adenosyl-L-methionine-dependent methyltransferase n=1 Tax=Teratosphaeria destructans TaxID=418781 RepID=A0A9W7SUI8_9PEZI|nr:S-adenosyl-L-methionine-dependent methyltransferase [Teratosphaeria destructans]